MKTYSSNLPNFNLETLDKTLEESVKTRELSEALQVESKFIRDTAETFSQSHKWTRRLVVTSLLLSLLSTVGVAYLVAKDLGLLEGLLP